VGRNFKSGRYGGRANLLSLGVAYSGAGKNHPPETWKSLLVEAGVHTTHLGGSKLVSGAGVLSAMQEHPSRIYLLDEFGMLWQQIANSKASGGHKAEIVDLLTQLYSSAGSMWNGTDRASRDEKDGPRDLICNPHLCLYGSATPESLFAGMSSMNAVDGSLARFLVFEGVKGLPQKNKASERRSTVDRVGIIERLVDLANPDRYHDVMLNSTAAQPASPIDVPWNDDATDYFDKADEWIDDLRRDNMGGIRQAFLARVMENAERIALIGAVCDHMPEPKVTLANAEWALHLAFNCCYNLISQLDDHLSDNEIEGKSKRLLKVIKDAGANGITKSLLVSRAQWIKARERNDLLADLQESGMVVAVQIEGTGSKPATTFTHAEYLING